MNSTVETSRCFSKSRGLWASVAFFPLPHPLPPTFLFSPHFSRCPNDSLARPEFRSLRTGMLVTQANFKQASNVKVTLQKIFVISALNSCFEKRLYDKSTKSSRALILKGFWVAFVQNSVIDLSPRCFGACATAENSFIGVFSSFLIAKQNYPNKRYANLYFSEKIFLEKGVELLLSSKIKTIGEYSLIGLLVFS